MRGRLIYFTRPNKVLREEGAELSIDRKFVTTGRGPFASRISVEGLISQKDVKRWEKKGNNEQSRVGGKGGLLVKRRPRADKCRKGRTRHRYRQDDRRWPAKSRRVGRERLRQIEVTEEEITNLEERGEIWRHRALERCREIEQYLHGSTKCFQLGLVGKIYCCLTVDRVLPKVGGEIGAAIDARR